MVLLNTGLADQRDPIIAFDRQFPDYQLIENPGFQRKEKLADLLDANGHIPQPVDRQLLHQAPYVLVILNQYGELIGGSSIKSLDDGVAEFGFTIVAEPYRRMGLGNHITRRRLNQAIRLGARLICSMVRYNNVRSRNNLKKTGFRFAGRYLHRFDGKTRLDWYVKWLVPMSRHQRNHIMRKVIADRVAVIY